MSILSMFTGADAYMKEIDNLQYQVDYLSKELSEYKVKAEDLQEELNLHKMTDADKMAYLRKDIKETEELYKRRIEEYDNLIELAKADIDGVEERVHRAFAEGRMNAYAEMGIRNIEAHERGNILVRMPDGEVVERMLGLEDVKADIEEAKADLEAEVDSCLENEITIDDLVDVEV